MKLYRVDNGVLAEITDVENAKKAEEVALHDGKEILAESPENVVEYITGGGSRFSVANDVTIQRIG